MTTTHTIAIAASGYGDGSAASASASELLARTVTRPLSHLGFTVLYVGECGSSKDGALPPAFESFSTIIFEPPRGRAAFPLDTVVVEYAVSDDAVADKVDALIRSNGYHSRRVHHHEDGRGSFTPFSGTVSELLVARWSELTALDELAESRKQTAELLEVLGLLTGREEISTSPTATSVALAKAVASKWAHDLANLVGAVTWSIEADGEPKPSVAMAIEELRLLVRGFRGEPSSLSSLSTDGLFAGFVAAIFDESMARKPVCDVEVEP